MTGASLPTVLPVSARAESVAPDLTPAASIAGETAREPIQAAPSSASAAQPQPPTSSADDLPCLPASDLSGLDPALRDTLSRFNPATDGWDSELQSEAIDKQYKKLGALLADPPKLTEAALAELISPDFSCPALRPDVAVVYRDEQLEVRRPPATPAPDTVHRGVSGATAALRQLTSGHSGFTHGHTHFKTIRVTVEGQNVRTSSIYQYGVQTERGVLQQTARWDGLWTRDGTGNLRLARIEPPADFEEVFAGSGHELPFVDRGAAVLGHNPAYHQQLLYGLDYWRSRLDWRLGLDVVGSHGLALGDVDGDGLDDIYVCEPGGLPNRLFLGRPDGRADDRSAEAGVDFLEPTESALILDFDNDGDQDLAVASGRTLLLLENKGAGDFELRDTRRLEAYSRSLSAADFDLDGDLDLYVCGYFSTAKDSYNDVGLGSPMPYHDANNGGRNALLRNAGGLRFEDATEATGLNQNNSRFSYAAVWEDYDNDGDPDLLVANDFGRKNLYRNDGGHFVDVAPEAGVEDIGAGMSASWADYDHDGWMDAYIGNMFSSAGNRVTTQNQFMPGADDETKAELHRHARGNSLFKNLGNGRFADVSVDSGVTLGRWAWGSNFIDLNNDGWEDLFVANGMVTSETDPADL